MNFLNTVQFHPVMDKPQTVDDDARFPRALKSMGTYFIINDAIGMRRDNWQIGANRVFPKNLYEHNSPC